MPWSLEYIKVVMPKHCHENGPSLYIDHVTWVQVIVRWSEKIKSQRVMSITWYSYLHLHLISRRTPRLLSRLLPVLLGVPVDIIISYYDTKDLRFGLYFLSNYECYICFDYCFSNNFSHSSPWWLFCLGVLPRLQLFPGYCLILPRI